MGDSPPGACEAGVVARVEDANRLLCDFEQLVGVDNAGDEVTGCEIEATRPFLGCVPERLGERDVLVEQAARVFDVAGPPERKARAPERLEALRITAPQQLAGAKKQIRGGMRVVARERTSAGGGEHGCRMLREDLIRSAECGAVLRRPLEVVADELVLTVVALEPRGKPLVQLAPRSLRHCRVRRVADESMAEAEAVVADERRLLRAHELLAHKR